MDKTLSVKNNHKKTQLILIYLPSIQLSILKAFVEELQKHSTKFGSFRKTNRSM